MNRHVDKRLWINVLIDNQREDPQDKTRVTSFVQKVIVNVTRGSMFWSDMFWVPLKKTIHRLIKLVLFLTEFKVVCKHVLRLLHYLVTKSAHHKIGV